MEGELQEKLYLGTIIWNPPQQFLAVQFGEPLKEPTTPLPSHPPFPPHHWRHYVVDAPTIIHSDGYHAKG